MVGHGAGEGKGGFDDVESVHGGEVGVGGVVEFAVGGEVSGEFDG